LPKIQNDVVDRLLSSVSEGLKYVTLVEESLNATADYVSVQKAAKVLWLEVEVSNKWIGNNLKNHAPEVNTAGLILHWFKNTAKDMVTEVQSMDIESVNDNSNYRSIYANSMYRITESILLSYHTNIDELSQEDLFMELSSMISDILAACLTNLPQVIVTRCHESMFSASSIVMGQKPEQQENFHDLRRYVLQLQDNMELSERTLKSISKSVNRLIVKAEKQQPNNLMKLVEVSKGFEGVGKYDSL
nr:hypothetical protein CTI12_AA467070 [Tanacetum cinerariifolium]